MPCLLQNAPVCSKVTTRYKPARLQQCTSLLQYELTRRKPSSSQTAYMLGASCTLEEHLKHPESKACLSLAQALLKKASAALEAAAQLLADAGDALMATKTLHSLVCTCHFTSHAAL